MMECTVEALTAAVVKVAQDTSMHTNGQISYASMLALGVISWADQQGQPVDSNVLETLLPVIASMTQIIGLISESSQELLHAVFVRATTLLQPSIL